jgi:hypothetical protein
MGWNHGLTFETFTVHRERKVPQVFTQRSERVGTCDTLQRRKSPCPVPPLGERCGCSNSESKSLF